MTAVVVPAERRVPVRGYQATGSTLLAIGLSLALIALGYGLKLFVESRSAEVSGSGVTALAPSGWRVDSTDRELIVRHPSDPNTLYAASVVESETPELADLGLAITLERAGLTLGFQVVGQAPVQVGDRQGEQVRYAYITHAGATGEAELIQGVDIYLPAGTAVIALSYEAPQEHFAEDYPSFEQFVNSARLSDQ